MAGVWWEKLIYFTNFFNSECSESGMTRNRKMTKHHPYIVILAAEEAFAGETSNQWYKARFMFNPLSAIWRIYPSSKRSSQWPYDGYIRHGWMTSCGRGRDSATSECFGQGSQETIFVRSSKISLFLPELCSFRRVFCFPRFCKIWRQTFKLWSFWFLRCLGAFFENSALSPGIFLRTLNITTRFFLKISFIFFQSRAGVTCLTAVVISRLSKALSWWYVEN